MSKKSKTRVKVELKKKYNDPKRNFLEMVKEFRRRVNASGILSEYKDHQFYESKSEKARKKKLKSMKKIRVDILETKILNGEDVPSSSSFVKKFKSNLNKDSRKESSENTTE